LLEVTTLGGLSIQRDGYTVTELVTRKAEALLVYLVCTDRTHSREVLAEMFWQKRTPERAQGNLRVALASLRKHLGDYVLISRDTVAINPEAEIRLDVHSLEEHLRMRQIEAALALYLGEFLQGFYVREALAFDEWLTQERERLCLAMVSALQHQVDRDLAGGAFRAGIEHDLRLLTLDPLLERAHRQMMLLLAASGQRGAALAQYETCRQVLAEELGVEPSPEIRETYELLLKGERPPGIPLAPSAWEREPGPLGECPYRGLAAFREEDAPFFFGREGFTRRLHRAVQERPQVAVIVGSSGSGKSSAVFAGLLPRLRAGSDAGDWLIAGFRPGTHPFRALAGSLVQAMSPELADAERSVQARSLADALRGGSLRLIDAVERALRKQPQARRLLLVADQFEELYTLCPERQNRRRFLDELLAAVKAVEVQPEPRLVLLLAMRADFMGRALAHRPFADALQEASVLLGPMNREELGAAVEKPAQVQGVAFEAGLVERILDDVGQEPGNLPLLEFALTLLWEWQSYGWLTHAGYEEIGRVEGALARYAGEVFGALDPEAQEQARRVFVQLVRPGEGTEDTRRLATRAEVGEENWALVQHLADKRLVVTGRDAAGVETVEVVHEALIPGWGQLQDWMEADRTFRTWQERLRAALRQWEATGGDAGALLRGAPLAEAEGWLAERGGELSEAERAFVQAGLALREQRAAEREARRQRELEAARALAAEQEMRADVEKRRAEEQARSAGRLQQRALLLAGAMAIAVVLAVAAVFAFGQASQSADEAQAEAFSRGTAQAIAVREGATAEAASTLAIVGQAAAQTAQAEEAAQRAVAQAEVEAKATQHAIAETEAQARATQQALAEERTRLATSRELSLAAQYNLEIDPERSILLALQAISLARTTQAEEALRQAVVASRVRLTMRGMGEWVFSVAYSPAGSRLAVSAQDGVFVRDATSGEVILTLPGEMVAYSPDGSRLATATEDGTVTIWDAVSGQELLRLAGHSDSLEELVFSPDGEYLATASLDDTVRVWDGASGRVLLTLPVPTGGWADTFDVAFSPGGEHLITVDRDGVVRIWDLATGDALLTLSGGAPIAISPDGKLLATSSAEPWGYLWLWDLEASLASGSAQALSLDTDQYLAIRDMAFSPDGLLLATSTQAPTVRVWTLSPEGAQESLSLVGHTAYVGGVAFSPDGSYLATGSDDGTARIWDISPGGNQEILTQAGHSDWFRRIAYSPDGARLATTNGDGQAIILDAGTGETLLTLAHPGGLVSEAVFSPDGTLLATAGDDNTARVWGAKDGRELLTLTGHEEGPPVGGMFSGIRAVAFSPDGKLLASAGVDGQARLWDVESGERVLALQVHPDGIGVTRLAFSPDGKRLAAASDAHPVEGNPEGGRPLVKVWDLASGQELYTVAGLPNRTWALAFSPNGSKLVVPFEGKAVKLYDAASGVESLSLAVPGGNVLAVAFSPDGALLATGGDEPPKLWDLATGQELTTFVGHRAMVNGLAFSPDGRRLASSSVDGTTRVYAVDVDDLVALARSRLTRWFTPTECRQYLHVDECPAEP
jgi:WD40 repeat protein/DNA-binding SARP family transcriptional activator